MDTSESSSFLYSVDQLFLSYDLRITDHLSFSLLLVRVPVDWQEQTFSYAVDTL